MKVKDVSLVPHQYERLTGAQKSRVQLESYLGAVALLSYEANRVINPVPVADRPTPLGPVAKPPPPMGRLPQPPEN